MSGRNGADRLRAYVLQNMQAIGAGRIETARFTLSVRTNPPAFIYREDNDGLWSARVE